MLHPLPIRRGRLTAQGLAIQGPAIQAPLIQTLATAAQWPAIAPLGRARSLTAHVLRVAALASVVHLLWVAARHTQQVAAMTQVQ